MKTDILDCCVDLPAADADGMITGRFCFPESFLGFQGHFPSTPILPAVVQLQVGQVCIASVVTENLVLNRVANAKFLDMIGADQSITVSCTPKGEHRFACSLVDTVTSKKLATFTLVFSSQ